MMDVPEIRRVIHEAFESTADGPQPVRSGKLTQAAMVESMLSGLLKRQLEGSFDLAKSDNSLSERQSVMLDVVACAERTLERSLHTDLSGYLTIVNHMLINMNVPPRI